MKFQDSTNRTQASVTSVGAYLPKRVVTNDELGQSLETNDQWIRSRVGIQERRIANDSETIVSMSASAGRNALEAGQLDPKDIDLIIVATCSMETSIPQAAAQVADALGIEVGAFDVNAGCSGFTSALSVAQGIVSMGTANRILVIGAERMSDWVDWSERSVAVLMGDGAAAVVVSGTSESGISPVVWGSLGSGPEVLGIPARDDWLRMDGRAVYKWGTSLSSSIKSVVEKSGYDTADISAFIPHQANERIIDALVENLDLPVSMHVARDIRYSGNTAAASVPLALARAMDAGSVSPGDLALVFGFGAGLAFSGQIIRIPERAVISNDGA